MDKRQALIVKRLRIGAIVLVAVYILIVVFLNTEEVETHLLFIKLAMPRALLLFVTLLIGFLAGFTTNSYLNRRRR